MVKKVRGSGPRKLLRDRLLCVSVQDAEMRLSFPLTSAKTMKPQVHTHTLLCSKMKGIRSKNTKLIQVCFDKHMKLLF